MKLWLISQDVNNDWDTYSDAVVAAEDELSARNIHPDGYTNKLAEDKYAIRDWCMLEDVKAEYIGEA